MAVDGWSPDGSPRLVCLGPPGGAVGGFTPNVFLGFPWTAQPPDPAMPSITPGTGDFSLELWARKKFGNSPGEDEQFWSGILEDSSGTPVPIAAIRWSNTDNSARATFDALGGGAPPAITVTGTPTVIGAWSHYAVNFDRNANMEFFIDRVSKGTAAISAQTDSVTGEVHALTADHTFSFHSATFTAWADVSVFNVLVGAFAIHGRLLTNAEIHDSYLNKKVQQIDGSTTIRFDWSKLEGQTGFDTDFDNMMLGHKVGLPVPAGTPQGAADTVTVRDQSGNSNHWTLPTVADYTSYNNPSIFAAEDNKWPLAFGADSFFR